MPTDKLNKCEHSSVARQIDTDENWTDKWICTRCGESFFHTETFATGKITFTPAPEPMPTLRDHFAMAALQGLMAANWKDCPYPTGYAEEAYKMADCLMRARQT